MRDGTRTHTFFKTYYGWLDHNIYLKKYHQCLTQINYLPLYQLSYPHIIIDYRTRTYIKHSHVYHLIMVLEPNYQVKSTNPYNFQSVNYTSGISLFTNEPMLYFVHPFGFLVVPVERIELSTS